LEAASIERGVGEGTAHAAAGGEDGKRRAGCWEKVVCEADGEFSTERRGAGDGEHIEAAAVPASVTLAAACSVVLSPNSMAVPACKTNEPLWVPPPANESVCAVPPASSTRIARATAGVGFTSMDAVFNNTGAMNVPALFSVQSGFAGSAKSWRRSVP
jgi:hypothetical protein